MNVDITCETPLKKKKRDITITQEYTTLATINSHQTI